jgi:hypothetical protein
MLKAILKKFPNVFKGGLGTLKIKPISLQVKPNAKPYHAKPVPMPKLYEQTTRKEVKGFRISVYGITTLVRYGQHLRSSSQRKLGMYIS